VRVLYVATKCPWPPSDGGRLVLKNTVEALAAAGDDVTVVCRCAAGDGPAPPGLRLRRAVESRSVPAAAWAAVRTAALTAARGLPLAVARHASRTLAREAARAIAEARPDVVFAEQLQSLPACRAAFEAGIPVVLRAQNVESDLWMARAALAGPAASRLYRFEAGRLRRWEGAAVRRCAATAALTRADADRLRALAGDSARVCAVAAPFPALLPAGPEGLPGDPALVLLASRGWWANDDGVRWFLREVWPAVAARWRGARLHLFGAGPGGRLPANVSRHPPPADSRDAFRPGSLFVVALRAASGVRMKILEAWARGIPVVATPAAAAGLESTDALRVASDAEGFVAAIETLAGDPGAAARLADLGRRDLARFHDPAAAAARLREIARAAAHGPASASTDERRSSA